MPYQGRQPGVGVRNRFIFTATSGQTSFSGADDNGSTLKYDDGAYVDAYLNGVSLIPSTDYAATTKTSVVLTSGAATSDILEVVAYGISSIADTVRASTGGTFAGAVTVDGNFTVDNGTIKLDGNYPVGTGNVALGNAALDSGSLSGPYNVAVGNNALTANTSGDRNIAIGGDALATHTTGSVNTVVGNAAMYANTTGEYNVAIGGSALASNTTGGDNTAVGYQAGYSNTTNSYSTYLGDHAGYAATNWKNTFLGHASGEAVTTGGSNTILGRYDGNQGGLDIRTSSNNIVLSDGDGNPRIIYTTADGLRLNNLQAGAGNSTLKYNTSTGVVFYDTSSQRFKENIRDSEYGLSEVLQLQSRQYEFIADGKSDIGLIAEEVDPIIPELVGRDEENKPISVAYDRFVSVLVKAIQEQQATITALEARITALENA